MEEENLVKKENEITSTNNSNNKNGIVPVLVLIIIALLGVVVYFVFIKKDDKPKDNNGGNNQVNDNTENYENKIMQGEYDQYGTIYLKGYADVKTYTEDYEGSSDADKYDLVSFHITDMLGVKSEEEISGWISHDENEKTYIRLGCVENDIISFNSVADDWYDASLEGTDGNYWKTVSLSKEDSQKIISSNANNPIVLKLEKLKFSYGGREGNFCTTSITGVEVIK